MEAGNRLDNVHYGDVAQQRENIGRADKDSCPAMSGLQSWEIHQYEDEAAGITVVKNYHTFGKSLPWKNYKEGKKIILS